MAEPTAGAEAWETVLAGIVGRRVAFYRRALGWNTGTLSTELEKNTKVKMARSTLGALESGTRRTVGLAEILALAFVLDVPPVLLMVPLDDEYYPALPGRTYGTWFSAAWITGEGIPPWRTQEQVDGFDRYRSQMDFLGYYREHHALILRWARTLEVEAAGGISTAEATRRQQEIESALKSARSAIRSGGGVPPRLPSELEGIEQRSGPEVPDA